MVASLPCWPSKRMRVYVLITLQLFSCVCSVSTKQLSGKRVILFSYGSGLAAAMYSLRVVADCGRASPLSALKANVSNIPSRLASRKVVPPAEFERLMSLREETHHMAPYTPQGSTADLFPSTFYLTTVDDKHRRAYNRVDSTATDVAKVTVSNGAH